MSGLAPLRRLAVLTAAVVVAAAACTSAAPRRASSSSTTGPPVATTSTTPAPAPTTALPLPAVAPASWKPCTGTDGPSGYECTTVQVPLDYANPSGRKIGIATDRKPATGTKIGSLLINPGGPGASGVDSLDYISSLFGPTVLDRFDIVGFDPRGVGRSSPVRCESGPQLDQFVHLNPAPSDNAGFQTLLAGARTFVQNCSVRSGPILPFVGTINAARDMDQIRTAVGDAKLSYIGFSYGTFLGATYADLFPTHIRAMVLDGALDPALGPIGTIIEQGAGFDQQLNAFFAFCTGSAICPWKPTGDMRAAYEAIIARIVAHPLPTGTARTLGPGEAFFGVAQTLYDSSTWAGLAQGLAQAEAGDGSALLQYSDQYTQRGPDGAYTNSLEANNAITCVDQPWPRDPTVIQQNAQTAKQRAPEFGVADLYGALPCTMWPATLTSQPHPISADGSPPIVVVGSTGDPATPYSDARGLAKELKRGVLLTRVGDGHTGYRSSACIRDHVDNYLVNLTVPAARTSCPTP